MPLTTVLVPTHDHGPTLRRSVASALAQTVSDLEVLVVGDGVPDVTRKLMAELASSDSRVRFFDNPKGPRHGEPHRHAALSEARGEIICYLSDDDLWLPDHLEQMRALLSESDFAHTLPLRVDPHGHIHHWAVDLELPFYRELLLGGENRIPHCCAGHTLELYRRLPAGWRAGPEGIPSDLYMWQQILSVPGCRAVSGTRPTVLHFPSHERTGWSSEERLDELDAWTARIDDAAWRDAFPQQVLDAVTVEDARLGKELGSREKRLQEQVDRLAELHGQVLALLEEQARLQEEQRRLQDEQRRLQDEHARLAALLHERERDLTMLASSVTWRLRERLVGLPLVSGPIRWAARALARPAAPAETGSSHPGPRPEETGSANRSPTPDRPSDSPAHRQGPSTP
jgi:glycosyl transferase family 2